MEENVDGIELEKEYEPLKKIIKQKHEKTFGTKQFCIQRFDFELISRYQSYFLLL